jgi:hypothetical protein
VLADTDGLGNVFAFLHVKGLMSVFTPRARLLTGIWHSWCTTSTPHRHDGASLDLGEACLCLSLELTVGNAMLGWRCYPM